MSEPEKPEPAPAAGAPADKPAAEERERKPFRPRRERPPRRDEKPPVVLEDLSARAPNLRDLNSQIQDELDAALAGFSDADLLTADPSKLGVSAPSAPGRK